MSQQTEESTEYVRVWIANDGDHHFTALKYARTEDIDGLRGYLRGVLKTAPEYSAPWHTMRGLSEDDLESVDWKEIAEDLATE